MTRVALGLLCYNKLYTTCCNVRQCGYMTVVYVV